MNPMNDNDRAWLSAMASKGEEDTPHPAYTKELRDRFVIVVGKTEKETFNHKAFAEWLVDESGYYFLTTRDDSIYIYVDGVYKPDGHTYIKTIIDEVMGGELLTPYMENVVIAKVRARTYVGRDVFDEGEDIVNMANGLYNIKSGEFRKHTHAYRSLSKSTVKYDAEAKCPNFDKFIREIVEPHRVETVYEMGGYALIRRKRVKRGFILLGKSDTGKTQLMNFFIDFIGPGGTAAINPIQLVRDVHAGAGLYGKHLNIVDDLGDAPLTETGILKSMIGDGMLTCNEKNKQAFPFRPYVMNIWGCNVLPKTTDNYFGDKFDILKLGNVYGGNDKPDRYLIDKITTDEELSGYFNKAMAAFRNVLKRGEFSGSHGQKERKIEWMEESTPSAKFVRARCDTTRDEVLTLKDAWHKQYDLWVKKNGLKREKKKDVKEYLESIGVYSTKVTARADDLYGKWCYLGIGLIQKDENAQHYLDQSTSYRKDSSDPDNFPIPDLTMKNSKNSIVEGVMGTKVGSPPKNGGDDSGLFLDQLSGSRSQPSKPIDFDQATIDRIRKATSDAMGKSNNSDGCDIDQITRATRGLARTTVAKCVLLNPSGAWEPGPRKGLYRLRT